MPKTDEEIAAEEAAAAEAARKAEEEKQGAKPPWGSDEDFNPERAWKLIQDLRADVKTVKTERDELRTKVQEHEDAKKTAEEKLAEKATGAEERATSAETEAARLRVALKMGLDETQARRLVGSTQDELEADAEALLKSFTPEGGENDDPPRRPRERLRPGASPSSEPDETDPEKLAASVPRAY